MVDDDKLTGDSRHLFELGVRRRGAPGPGEQREAALPPQLQELDNDFREIGREARTVAEGLSRQQFNWRPGAGRWSISECLVHLNIMGSDVLPLIDSGIQEARSRGWTSSEPFAIGIFGRRLIRATEPPVQWKRSAAAHFVPSSDQASAMVVPALVDLQTQLSGRVRVANGLNIARVRVSVPGRRMLRVNLYELLLYVAAHQRRHLAQAWQVRRDRMFPKAPPARPATAPQRP